MSRLSKLLLVFVMIAFVLACNAISGPVSDIQDAAGTVEAVASAMPVETLQSIATNLPVETIQAAASEIPFENMFDPQGTPVSAWNDIPIMPEATAGQEFTDTNTYSFKVNATAQEVKDYYDSQLPGLGWSSTFNLPVEDEGGILSYSKDSTFLTVTISKVDDVTVVILTLV